MQPKRQRYAVLFLILIVSLSLTATWLAFFNQSNNVHAAPVMAAAVRYVSPEGNNSGNDCTDSNSPCATLQHGVDVSSSGDEIRAALGDYTGSQVRADSSGYTYTQVVYIDKDLTLRGGYATTNWEQADPDANPTIIDAEGYGRGITILGTGTEVITIDGFTITNGDYTDLGNPFGDNQVCWLTSSDCAGGIFVKRAGIQLLNSKLENNHAGDNSGTGGGLFLWRALTSHIENTLFQGNTADDGGGLLVDRQFTPLTIQGCTFQDNTADDRGGGINLAANIENLITISDTQFLTNTAVDGKGGGLFGRLVSTGLILQMDRVVFQGNQTSGRGKAMMIESAGSEIPKARLTNLLFTHNADTTGSPADDEAVLAIGPGYIGIDVELAHLTAADNLVPTFLHAATHTDPDDLITVTLTNTLISGFANGYGAMENGSGQLILQHTKTLFHNVDNQEVILGGTPTLTAIDPIVGNPLLDFSYHLQAGSDAIDAGVEAGVHYDIDGDSRPIGKAPDIGADETILAPYVVFIPLVQR
jgi:hypothetical protein